MSHGNEFPVLTQEECLQILHHVRRIGPVRFPWELAVYVAAIVAMASSLALLTLHSWVLFATSVALLATSFLFFQLLLHECAHDALFRSRSWNTISGWLIGLLVITPFFSFRRGHAVHHSCVGTDDDPTAAPRDFRRHNFLIDILVLLRVVPVLYLGGVYGPYLLFDFQHRSRQRRRHLIVYGINLLCILAVHSSLAWTFGWERYVSLLLAAFWLSGILYEYFLRRINTLDYFPVPKWPTDIAIVSR